MADVVDKLSIVRQFLNILTWKKIAQLSVFLFVLGLSWALYENRKSIYGLFSEASWAQSPGKNVRMSKTSTDSIDAIVNKSDLIAGIQITLVDFHKNTRILVYTYADDENLKKIYTEFLERSIGDLPLFNADTTNNVRLSQLINGEFICNPIQETIVYKLAPESAKSVTTVCATGIPPIYGRFTGIYTIYLTKNPSKEEIDQLRLVSKGMAKEIFERDFK